MGSIAASEQATTFNYPVSFVSTCVGTVQHANTSNAYHGFAISTDKSSARIFIDTVSVSITGFYIILIGR